jgi:hypothetical protein
VASSHAAFALLLLPLPSPSAKSSPKRPKGHHRHSQLTARMTPSMQDAKRDKSLLCPFSVSLFWLAYANRQCSSSPLFPLTHILRPWRRI